MCVCFINMFNMSIQLLCIQTNLFVICGLSLFSMNIIVIDYYIRYPDLHDTCNVCVYSMVINLARVGL